MGHRALVAVAGSDGRYACYRSQWGALAVEGPGSLVTAVADAVMDGRLVARDCTVAAVCDAVDPRSDEALLVASGDAVEPLLVVWLGLVLRDGVVGDDAAALVPVADAASARRFRGSLLAWRESLGVTVDDGSLSPAVALAVFRAGVARLAAPARPVWLPLGGGGAG